MDLKDLRRPSRIPYNDSAARPHLYLGRTRWSSQPARTDSQLLESGNAPTANEWGHLKGSTWVACHPGSSTPRDNREWRQGGTECESSDSPRGSGIIEGSTHGIRSEKRRAIPL